MPIELYVVGFITLFIPFAILGIVLGGLYGFFRYTLPYLIKRRRKRRAREAESLAAQHAGQQREIVMVDYERL